MSEVEREKENEIDREEETLGKSKLTGATKDMRPLPRIAFWRALLYLRVRSWAER